MQERRDLVQRRRLSVVHAEALYRPFPPVDLDDDGFICRDRRVSESTSHGELCEYVFGAAQSLLAHLPDALVASDLAILFEWDNPGAIVSPELMVALNAGCHHRNSYKFWEERAVPDLALEAFSVKTWRKDLEVKPGLYRDLGVREFWMVDPLGKLPEPIVGRRPDPIVGWRLSDVGTYEEIPTLPSGGRRSDVLGAELFFDDRMLRFRELKTGEVVPTYVESCMLRAEAEAQARRMESKVARAEAEAARKAAEKRVAELEGLVRQAEGR